MQTNQHSLQIEKRYPIELGEVRAATIVLAGCGGTGSFLALHLARLAYHLREQAGPALQLRFVDPDVVEHKNVGRQNFVPAEAEAGVNKAWALARRYSAAFGLAIEAYPEEFSGKCVADGYRRDHFRLVIGCVDTPAARRDIHAYVAGEGGRVWWLDAGNEQHAGQVLLGNRADLEEPEISPMGFCSGLPLPNVREPSLLGEGGVVAEGESCAELAAAGVQSLMVNQAMAGWAAQYVCRLLVSRDLDVWGTWVDMESGSAKSAGIGGVPVEAGEIR